jgi:ABC-type dipeptide/oligopeptide/nickel transport system permease subunit
MSSTIDDPTLDLLAPSPAGPPGDERAESQVLVGRYRGLVRGVAAGVRELWGDKAGFAGATFLLVVILVAIFGPWLVPHDPAAQSLPDRLTPPFWADGGSWTHPLGTDNLGRDVLSRLMVGSRISLFIGVAVCAAAGGFGVLMGLLAGYKGGRTDSLIMRIVDTQVAFPGLLLALIVLAVVGPSVTALVVVLAANGWMVYARITRGTVLSVKEMPYVEAAELAGCRPRRVVFRHILPNLTSPLLTLGILEFARIVLAEAALSYLGLGIQPPNTSWGLDIAIGKDYLYNAWWLVTFPGIAIALTVLSINLVASWLRVVADPQARDKRFASVSMKAQSV